MILLKNRDRNPSFKKGEYVEINDAGNYPMELSVDGVCEQVTTTGKNNIDKDNYILDTWDNNYDAFQVSLKAGTYTLSSNTTMETIKASNHIGADWGSVPFGTSEKTKEYTFTISEDYNGGVVIKLDGGLQINHTNIANYDIQLENGSIATDYEPYTGGQPSPSPDYPQEIKTITDSLSVTSCNKNLLALPNKTIISNGVTSTIKNNELTIKGTCTQNWFGISENLNLHLKAGTYTFSRTTKDAYRYDLGVTLASGTNEVIYGSPEYNTTFTIDEDFIINYLMSDANIVGTSFDFKDYVQLEQGSQATSFEEHLQSKITANLPENEFIGKINDTYKDTLKVEYNEEDAQYHLMLNKMVGKIILDGTQNILRRETINSSKFRWYFKIPNINNNVNCLCDYLISGNLDDGYETVNSITTIINNIAYYGNCVFYREDFADKTISEAKQLLAQNNMIIYYALQTPYTIDLGIVDTLLSYNEVTNVFSDSDLYPVINVKYYKDFEFDKILRSGYNIDEQEYEIARKQMANGKRKRILSSYDDCIIKINLGLLDNKTYQEYKEQLNDGEFHYWSYKYNQYKKANFILTKPSITTEYAYDDEIGIDDIEITLEKSSDVS